jgi:hypothetical protein
MANDSLAAAPVLALPGGARQHRRTLIMHLPAQNLFTRTTQENRNHNLQSADMKSMSETLEPPLDIWNSEEKRIRKQKNGYRRSPNLSG